MRLLHHYRRFDNLPPDEHRRKLVEQHREERLRGERDSRLLDLSGSTPPTLPNAEVVNAALTVARTRLHSYPDPGATAACGAIATRHGVSREQVALGNGAAELIRTATGMLLRPGGELITPFPSYPLYPTLASEVGAKLISVPLADDGTVDPGAVVGAVTDRTGVVLLCNPNDPTGGYLPAELVGDLIRELPDTIYVLLDEALADFQAAEELDATLRLTERFENLVCFRSFSRAYGLSGLRGGYAVGSPAASDLISSLAPALGVNAVTQAAVAYAMEHAGDELERRRGAVIRERKRLLAELESLPVEVTSSEAPFVWLRAPGLSGSELAGRLERAGIRVAPGEPLGDPERVRVAVHDARATGRVTTALTTVLGQHRNRPEGETPVGTQGRSEQSPLET